MDGYNLTMKDIKKFEVLMRLVRKEIKGYQAASLLGYSKVHISRLKKRVLEYGLDGLLHTRKGCPRKISEEQREKIRELYVKPYYESIDSSETSMDSFYSSKMVACSCC